MPTNPKPKKMSFHVSSATAKMATPPKLVPQSNGRLIFFCSGNRQSKSCRAMMKTFGTFKIANVGNNELVGKKIDLVNWGWGSADYFYGWDGIENNRVFNKPTSVNLCRNKLKFFQKATDAKDGPRVPVFVTTLDEAKALVDKGEVVFGRKHTGSCGTDIATFDQNPAAFGNSDFWTVYKKKKHEFRVHVFRINGVSEVVDVQQKALRKLDPVTNQPIDTSKVNFQVRNHRNGFIFQRNDITVPEDVKVQAIKAFDITGLDFGAIDVIWNEHEGKAYVLEVNTAPGLEGTTLDNYVSAIRRMTA